MIEGALEALEVSDIEWKISTRGKKKGYCLIGWQDTRWTIQSNRCLFLAARSLVFGMFRWHQSWLKNTGESINPETQSKELLTSTHSWTNIWCDISLDDLNSVTKFNICHTLCAPGPPDIWTDFRIELAVLCKTVWAKSSWCLVQKGRSIGQ